MVLLHTLRVTLVSALVFTFVSGHCTNPKVRKEWRSLCADERAAWIDAVKVFLLFSQTLSIFAQITSEVSCKEASQPEYRSHRRPCDFVNPTYYSKQFLL